MTRVEVRVGRPTPRALTLREYYETPQAFIQAQADDLRARVPALFRPAESGVLPWCAPCVGRGAILEGWDPTVDISAWETNDLDSQWGARLHGDASRPTTWQAFRPARTVVENPAFSVAFPVLEQALAYAQEAVVLHVRLSFLEATKDDPRGAFLHALPPRGILVLPRFAFRRSSKTGKWSTDSMATCWLTWLGPAYDHVEPWIATAGPDTLQALEAETPAYRRRIDSIAGIPSPAHTQEL